MKKIYSKLAFTLLTCGAVSAEPWHDPMPVDLTQADKDHARSANKAHAAFGWTRFGLTAHEIDWAKDYVMHDMPLSNLSKPSLSGLLTGNYHIYGWSADGEWSVRYYDKTGKTYFCEPASSGQYTEWVYDRYIEGAGVGLAGIMHWNPNRREAERPPENQRWGWPVVADPDTGEIGLYSLKDGVWRVEIGWIQSSYPSDAEMHCPKLPRGSEVNTLQSGHSLKDMAKAAKPVRSFPRAFKNDPRAPLTAEKYYYLHPPMK